MEEISHFTQWCTDNYLELNVDKTKELVIETTHTALNPLLINGKTVEQVDSFKYLGLTLDKKLRFDQHYNIYPVTFSAKAPCNMQTKITICCPPSSAIIVSKHYPTYSVVLFRMFLHHTAHAKQEQTFQYHPHCFQDHRSPHTLTF